ncbi:hypothetical protein [Paenibacillus cremeus]|uniref:hypothetical protein n=1 Tax=Paenibacillus cremeus TaxID=2163881 RepID=UPI0021BD1859|nr:hypothetical protein [Paenibacillus cremeus]
MPRKKDQPASSPETLIPVSAPGSEEAAAAAIEPALEAIAPQPASDSPDEPEPQTALAPIAADEPEAPSLTQVLEGKLKKKQRSETHDKERVYLRKDLKERLDALSLNRSKGFKTLILNYGLEKALDELEQAAAQLREDEKAEEQEALQEAADA